MAQPSFPRVSPTCLRWPFQVRHASQQLCDETVIGCWFPCLGTVIGHGYRAGLLPAMVPDQSLELSHPQMELQGPHLGALPQGLN